MTFVENINVNKMPVRFFPEASQALRTWLTANGRELETFEDLRKDPPRDWYFSKGAGGSLSVLLLKYGNLNSINLEISIPAKYVSKINIDNFIAE